MVCYYTQSLTKLQEIVGKKEKHFHFQKKQSTKTIQELNWVQENLHRTYLSLIVVLIKLFSPFTYFKRLNCFVNVFFGTNCHPSFLLFSPMKTTPLNFDIHHKNYPTTSQLCAFKYNVVSSLFSLAYVPNFFF